jgi:hypothetical protein
MQRSGPTRPWQENLDQYSASPSTLKEDKVEAPSAEIAPVAAALANKHDSELPGDEPQSTSSVLSDNPVSDDPHARPLQENLLAAQRSLRNSKQHVPAHARSLQGAETGFAPTALSNALSPTATRWIDLVSKHGFDMSMKIILVEELSDFDGYIRCSQQAMASTLKISLKSIKRLFDDLCALKLIELAKESDPGTKSPREYRILKKQPSLPS